VPTKSVRTATLLLTLLAPLAAAGAPKGADKAKGTASRELRRRTLTFTDASVTTLPELLVAGGTATVITFQIPIAEGGAIPGTSKELFFPIVQTDKTILIVPRADLAAPVPLNVSLTDGTVLTFKCVSNPTAADAQVDVLLALEKRAAQESPTVLKATIGQLRGQLDECRATTGDAGAQKVASLLIQQSLDKPQTFARHQLRSLNKENRILAEARWAYRLLGLLYVVLTVENRDPERAWVLDHVEVKVNGAANNTDVQVKTIASEFPSLAPDASGRVVIGFTTPATNANQTVTLTLFEKDGNRRVSLSNLDL
jgi:uncharacterized protein (TIGR02268 family)